MKSTTIHLPTFLAYALSAQCWVLISIFALYLIGMFAKPEDMIPADIWIFLVLLSGAAFAAAWLSYRSDSKSALDKGGDIK